MTLMNPEFDNNEPLGDDEKYLHGQCHIFALALHKLSKLPLYALMDYDPEIEAVCLVHATVKLSDANSENKFKVLDISGLQYPDEVVEKYPTWEPGWTQITPAALLKLAEGSKMTDDIAKQIEQAIPRAKEVLESVQEMGIEIKKIKKLKQ